MLPELLRCNVGQQFRRLQETTHQGNDKELSQEVFLISRRNCNESVPSQPISRHSLQEFLWVYFSEECFNIMDGLKSGGAFSSHIKEETTGIPVKFKQLGCRSGKTEGISKIYHRNKVAKSLHNYRRRQEIRRPLRRQLRLSVCYESSLRYQHV